MIKAFAFYSDSPRTENGVRCGDALFNFPAYQSVKQWSSGGSSAYLYSFEHTGNLSKGSHFLPGVALADDSGADVQSSPKERAGPSHGDELAYIFEPLDNNGKSVSGEVSGSDARARDNFVKLIARFAHELKPVDGKNGSKLAGFLPFTSGNEQFLKINEGITMDKDFRYCQMGLWGNMANRLTGALCKNLIGNLLNLDKLVGTPNIKLPVQVPTNLPVQVPTNLPMNPLGQLGGLVPQKQQQQQNRPTRTTQRPSMNFPKLPFRF
ncbi:hypothetical protein MSG28_008179 [Choristoneura fumiferana]|uniref:Uncharacterized protein n=1 Tax=Choristoneura fumiferana TaxID=7141 RepID=A0ACC0JAA6_CHOFU|nr:hypothetical protein MSG28_008179 [Choristoneura fumiferana]